MLYDVSVNRIQTATKTIRVEADSRENAEEKAVEQAHDEEFAGCVTEYAFEASEVVEVADPTLPVHTMSIMRPDSTDRILPALLKPKPDTKCALCPTIMPDDLHQAIDSGWLPSYWDGEVECEGPVCPTCAKKYLEQGSDGETVLKETKGEYVTVWASGKHYQSPCKVNIRNRMVEVLETFDATEDGELLREYVVFDGKEYEAASAQARCEYTLKDQAEMFFRK